MIAPTTPAKPEMTLRQFFDSYYRPLKLRGRTGDGGRLHHVTLNNFAKHLGREATFADLTDETVSRFLDWLQTGQAKPRQATTVNDNRNRLLAIWRFASRKRMVDTDPDVEAVPELKRAPQAWTLENLARLLSAVASYRVTGSGRRSDIKRRASSVEGTAGVPHAAWWTALVLTLYDTGLRVGAALQLRCCDYDPMTRRLAARAETQKHKADQSWIVSEQTAAALGAILRGPERELLFPWQLTLGTLYNRYTAMLKAAGLSADRHSKFHRLRKTSATMVELHAGRGAAFHHLGHSSPKLTEKYLDRSMLPEYRVVEHLPRPTVAVECSALSNERISDLLSMFDQEKQATMSAEQVRLNSRLVQAVIENACFLTAGDIEPGKLLASMRALMAQRKPGKSREKLVSAASVFVSWLVQEKGVKSAAACFDVLTVARGEIGGEA